MQITFPCNKCGTKLEIDAGAAGQTVLCPQCQEPLTVPVAEIKEGTILGGFRIERLLGEGGMGEVYLARQLSMDRPVALKILPAEVRRDKSEADRFLQEVRVLARMEHPNIVAAYEAGEDNGVLFLAMGYVQGRSLEERIRREGPMPWKEACDLTRKLAGAMAYAWDEHRLLHRDIKPANVLLDSHGEPKLVDLGLAKNLGPSQGLTMSGTIMGTPNYMSPEQIEAREDLDFRADMYSLGATLWHMLTGKAPFHGSSLMDTLRRQAAEPLVDPRQCATDVPEGVVMLLEVLVAKDREHRYESWAALIADLQRVLSGHLPQRCPPAAGGSMLNRIEAKPAVLPALYVILGQFRRPAAMWVVATGCAIALLLGLMIWQAGRHERGAAVNLQAHVPSVLSVAAVKTEAPAPGKVLPAKDRSVEVGQAPAATKAAEELAVRETAVVNAEPPGQQMKVDLGGGVKLEMVWIQPGKFVMGSPAKEAEHGANETLHEVKLTKGFWIGKFEVTQAQWERVMGNNPGHFKQVGKDAPVESVSWNDCQEFIKKMNSEFSSQKSDVGQFRLPTEAEWEYACRAGTKTRFSQGDAESDLDVAGWYKKNANGTTHPVGQKKANAWGLYDMHGNVWEWCQDWFGDYPAGDAKDPVGPSMGSARVLRGGSWSSAGGNARSALRCCFEPGYRLNFIGLRIVSSVR